MIERRVTYPRRDSLEHIIIGAIHGTIKHNIGNEVEQNRVIHGGVDDGLEDVDCKASKDILFGDRILADFSELAEASLDRNGYS